MRKHITDVIGLLNENAEYAVLRNFEGLPERNDSRDIDIIITEDSLRKVLKPLVRMIDESGWKVVAYLKSDRLVTLVVGFCNALQNRGEEASNADAGVELVQWDFFVNTSVWGLELMSAEEFLVHKQWNGFLWYVGVECQFLDKYLYNRTVGAKYPEKYKATRDAVEHSPMVEAKLKAVFNKTAIAGCDSVPGRGLLKEVIKSNMRHPIKCIASVFVFVFVFVKNYMCSRTGFSVGFTGPDGAGKTTVIDTVIEEMGDVFRKAHAYYHFRPTLYGNLGDVAHKAGVKSTVDRDYDHPHRSGKKGVLSSLCRLAYYSIDYIIGYWLKVKTVTRITKLVIFDRYYTDIICDSRRSCIYLPPRFLYWYGKLLIPSLDYNILLTASTDKILERKAELDIDGINDINRKIDYLAGKKEYIKVVNDGTPKECAHEIIAHIFEEQHRRNMKRVLQRVAE